jgi:cytidylate kinase
MIRSITFAGEYGSGRREMGSIVAGRLGWRLIDSALIEEIARTAHVDPAVVRQYDECVDPWLHRMRKALWRGGYEGVVTTTEQDLLDAESVAALTRCVIESAAKMGDCVIVGRASQCILQDREDTFHVFVYGPFERRVERVARSARPGEDPAEMVRATDRMRQAYIRRLFDQEWTNPHLYDLMLCMTIGETAVVEAVLAAVRSYGAK